MTVSELIAKLQKQPPDKEVLVSDVNGDYEIPIVNTLTCRDYILILPLYSAE